MINFKLIDYLKMTLNEFNKLSELKKAEYLWSDGVHLCQRFTDTHTIVLYSLDEFYCEILYNRKKNKAEEILSFKSIDRLEPYVNFIQLNF